MSKRAPDHAAQIADHLRAFKLTTMADELVPRLVTAGCESALPTLCEVLALEEEARHTRRVQRLLRAAKLPEGKCFETFDESRLPSAVVRKLHELRSGVRCGVATARAHVAAHPTAASASASSQPSPSAMRRRYVMTFAGMFIVSAPTTRPPRP